MRPFLLILPQLLLTVLLHAQPPANAAIIIGDGVRLRAEASAKSAEVLKLTTGAVVTILKVAARPDGLGSAEVCDQYPWVQVRTAAGKRGWVYGKYVFRAHADSLLKPAARSFQLGGKTYFLDLVRNYGVGASNDDGLTGCQDFYPLVVWAADGRSARLIQPTGQKLDFKDSIPQYLHLDDNDGIGETITAIRQQPKSVVLEVKVEFQDLGGAYSIEVTEQGGKLSGRVFGWRERQD